MHLRSFLTRTALLGACLASLAASASAQLNFHVELNTASLAGGTYYMQFTLSDGSAAGLGFPDSNNSATISNFTFGGGSPGAILLPYIGNASGAAPGNITLADGDGEVADATQEFSSGITLGFDVSLTTNVDAGPVAEQFSFHLLDSSFNQLPTTDPTSGNAFVLVNVTSSSLNLGDIGAYGTPEGNEPFVPAPTITLIGGQVNGPEPGTLAFLLPIAGAGFAVQKRRKALS